MINEAVTTVNDLTTRFLHGGTGPTVLFLHDGAWGASSDVTWGQVAELAAKTHSVIAPDMLGFGGSAKSVRLDEDPFRFRLRHIYALLDARGVTDPVHVVGNSFGASVALRGLADPHLRERIASVTAISGTGGPWRTPESAQLGPFDGTEANMARIVDLLCGDYPGAEAQVAARMGWARSPGHYAATMAIHQQVPEPLQFVRPADPYPANLTGVDVPVLLFECTEDPLVEQGWTSNLTDLLPQSRVVEIPRRHAPNITHPEETWTVVKEFLDKVQGA